MSKLEELAKEYAREVAPIEQFEGDEAAAASVYTSIEGDFIEGFYSAAHIFLDWINQANPGLAVYADVATKYDEFIEDHEEV